jgi:hypothetical protein
VTAAVGIDLILMRFDDQQCFLPFA